MLGKFFFLGSFPYKANGWGGGRNEKIIIESMEKRKKVLYRNTLVYTNDYKKAKKKKKKKKKKRKLSGVLKEGEVGKKSGEMKKNGII